MRHIHLVGAVQQGLARDDGLDDYIFDPRKQPLIVNLMLTKNLPQCFETPLGSIRLPGRCMLGNGTVLILFVDGVVRQMDELVFLPSESFASGR